MDKLLTSWPLALVVCVVIFLTMFRRPISGLIDRCRRLGFGDKSIDLSDSIPQTAAQQQQKQVEAPPTDIISATVPAAHALPPTNELYIGIENEIREALATAKVPPEIEKAWILRGIAVARTERTHEIVYRTILGSQISLLLQANTVTPPNLDKAREIYEAAKSAFPAIYTSFSFESWISYPLHIGLLRCETDEKNSQALIITLVGRDFLHYLVNTGLTAEKFG